MTTFSYLYNIDSNLEGKLIDFAQHLTGEDQSALRAKYATDQDTYAFLKAIISKSEKIFDTSSEEGMIFYDYGIFDRSN